MMKFFIFCLGGENLERDNLDDSLFTYRYANKATNRAEITYKNIKFKDFKLCMWNGGSEKKNLTFSKGRKKSFTT